METWKFYNFQWGILLWDEEKIKKLNLKNKLAFNSTTNQGSRSDIARYDLNKFGGYILIQIFNVKIYPRFIIDL